MIAGVEAALPGVPLSFISDGGVVPETPALVTQIPSLRTRILGTVAGDFSTPSFAGFAGRFNAQYGAMMLDAQTAAPAYDAAYLVAYAAAATTGQTATGSTLAQGMRAITGTATTPIAVGPDSINAAFQALERGQPIKVTPGASSGLDFVGGTGDPIENITVEALCTQGGAVVFQSSGQYLDAASGTLAGQVASCD